MYTTTQLQWMLGRELSITDERTAVTYKAHVADVRVNFGRLQVKLAADGQIASERWIELRAHEYEQLDFRANMAEQQARGGNQSNG